MTAQPPLADLLSQQRVLFAHIEKEARKVLKQLRASPPISRVDEYPTQEGSEHQSLPLRGE